MEKVQTFLENKLQPAMQKFSNNRYLQAIQNGFFGAMPVMIIGSIFLLFTNFPVPGYTDFMASIFGENWSTFFSVPHTFSLNILSLFIFFGIIKSLSDYYEVDTLGATVVSLVGYLIINPPVIAEEGAMGISMSHMGSGGLFLSIISAIFALEIYRWVIERGWTIKMPESVPPSVSRSFTSLIPGFVVVIVFNLIRMLFSFTQFGTVYDFIYDILQAPLTNLGGTLPVILLIIFLDSFLWFFGIHGASVTSAALGPVTLSLSAENAEAFAAGQEIPNIISQQFLSVFVNIGGAGSTLGLVILCLIMAKSQRYKTLGKLAVGPGIFMINEPIMFGMPMVLNPMMFIPLIFVPLILGIITYIVMSIGLVPYTIGVNIPWTTPPIVGGYIQSGWAGAVYQIFEILLSMLLYYPFFKIEDNKAYEVEQESVEA